MKTQYTYSLECEETDIECEFDFEFTLRYHPRIAPVFYDRNGDGQPGEADYVEISNVVCLNRQISERFKRYVIQKAEDDRNFVDHCCQILDESRYT